MSTKHQKKKSPNHNPSKNHQFQVRDPAEKTGGFHTRRSGSTRRLPLIFSFSRCLRCWWRTASVRTMTWLPFCLCRCDWLDVCFLGFWGMREGMEMIWLRMEQCDI